jgi:voltage-gated potassium channel
MDLGDDTVAKVFTLFVVVFGMGNLLFLVSAIAGFFADGEFQQLLRRRKMRKEIEKLSGHYIICGGKDEICDYVIDEIEKTGRKAVIVGQFSGRVEEREEEEKGRLYINGDPADDDTLRKAGIEDARGIVSILPHDQDNVFVALTARGLNPDIRIVAKCVDTKTREKLTKAGADSSVSPDFIGALRMASELMRPTATNFLDKMLRAKTGSAVRFEDVRVKAGCSAIGQTIGDVNINKAFNLLVVGILPRDGEDFIYSPPSDYILKEGDEFVVLGDVDKVNSLREFLQN